ncbi:MAG: 1-acyl-sn-glycerol-3-phosphate acyltransferase, partial [Bacilli bacterium]|nr:1-acyl-sn-glycerol-3-phosphate acyltransferase [Bacilli bacterium]
ANHQSNYDFLGMAIGTKRPIHFMVKKELFKNIIKPLLYSIKAIPVDRKKKNPEAMSQATKYLKQKKLVGIFPEGTFNKTLEPLAPFKMGTIKLAYENNVPIIPILIKNQDQKRKLWIHISQPFYVATAELEKENEKLRQIMIEIKGEKWK